MENHVIQNIESIYMQEEWKVVKKENLKKKLSSDLSFHTYSWNAFHEQMHIS